MKSSLSFKAKELRQRNPHSFSRQNSGIRGSDGPPAPREPTAHHGKMYAGSLETKAARSKSELVEIVLCISVNSVHAVTEEHHTVAFQSPLAAVREGFWDHSERSVHFKLDDGSISPVFIFPVLTEVETQLSAVLATAELAKIPSQVYMGVLIGESLPSPIQQYRMPLSDVEQPTLPMPKRRELLRREQPVRNAIGRERLGVEYMRSGCLSFTCSINGDLRGLNLDVHHVRVFPSPDCHDRSACLFSYLYESLESCEVTGTRVELRFRMEHDRAKQPEYLAFQSLEAQRIREAIWYLKYGTYIDDWIRERLASQRPSSPSSRISSRRTSTLTCFGDEDSLKQRIDACCRVIGCQHRVDSSEQSGRYASEISASNVTIHINSGTQSHVIPEMKTTPSISRMVTNGLCDEHISLLASQPNSSPSKRGSFFSRDKSSFVGKSRKLLLTVLQSSHYLRMFKYQGQLLKRQSDHKFQLKKAWKVKIAVLFETPVGGFLCYYDRVAHAPGMADPPKERRVIDLSSVMFIRPVSASITTNNGGSGANGPTPLAFDLVTLYRTWTFATIDSKEYEIWLNVLIEAVEKHASIAPDKPLRFPIKLARTEQSSPTDATTLEISSYGVCLCAGPDAEVELCTWYFTELEKWSIVQQQHYTCCLLSCRSPPVPTTTSSRSGRPGTVQASVSQDYLLQTPEASNICLAIEFYVGKCMAKMEVLTAQYWEKKHAKQTAQPGITPSSSVPKLGLPPKKVHLVTGISLVPIGAPTSVSHGRSNSLLPAVPEGIGALDDGSDSGPSSADLIEQPKSPELRVSKPSSSREEVEGVSTSDGVKLGLSHHDTNGCSQTTRFQNASSGAPADNGELSLVTLNDINLEWTPENGTPSGQDGAVWCPGIGDCSGVNFIPQKDMDQNMLWREDTPKEREIEPADTPGWVGSTLRADNSTDKKENTLSVHTNHTDSADDGDKQGNEIQPTLALIWTNSSSQELDSCLPSPVPIMEERSSSLLPLLELQIPSSILPLQQDESNSGVDQGRREDTSDRRSSHEPSEPSETFDSCISEVDFLNAEVGNEAADCGELHAGTHSCESEEELETSCAESDDDQFEDAIDPGALLGLGKEKATTLSE